MNGFSKLLYLLLISALLSLSGCWKRVARSCLEAKALDADYLPQTEHCEEAAADCRQSLDATRAGLTLLVSPSPWG